MEIASSSSTLSQNEYQALLEKGSVFHQIFDKNNDEVAFIQAIQIQDTSIKDSTKEALEFLAAQLKKAQNILQKVSSSACVRVIKEYCSEIQQIQAKILQSQPSNRKNNIKGIFGHHDLHLAKTLDRGKVVILTEFSPVSLKIKQLDAFCSHCKRSHIQLKDFRFSSRERFIVLTGKLPISVILS